MFIYRLGYRPLHTSKSWTVWARAGQWVTNFGTVGNRYDFEFSILLSETA